jgi:sodium-dependent dicarboxylate transporter 2/3/5
VGAFASERGWSAAERRLLPLLAVAVAAWILLPLLKVPALAGVEDASIAILAALALFVIPAGQPGEPRATLLEWRDTARAPWDVLFLFGGGLALADAITRTGLGAWLGGAIGALGTLPLPVFVVLVTLAVIAVTEFASNVAAAASFIPVVAGITVALGLDPLVLTLPAALAASWGFMMPAGTPPNAIAYATGIVTVGQMIRAGLWINLLGLVAIPAAVAFGVATFLGR